MFPNSSTTGALVRRWPCEDRDKQETLCGDEGKDWSDAATSGRTPEPSASSQKLEAGKEESHYRFRRVRGPADILFRLLASRTVKQGIFIVLSHPVCGTMLWPP